MMKKLMVAASLCFAAVTANAADMAVRPVKAPAPAAAVFSWTGFYIGANVGGAWATDDTTWTSAGFGGGAFPVVLDAAGTGGINTSGVTAGGQIGFNYQVSPFAVLGAEADIAYTDLSASRLVAIAPPAVPGTTAASSISSRWLATVRGRLGFLPAPNVMLYGTGGVAFAQVKTADVAFFAADGSSNAAASDTTRTGWTAGGGVEWAFLGAWSVKAEYLYVDLGRATYTSLNNFPANAGAVITHDHRLTENIARVGLNYQFGWR